MTIRLEGTNKVFGRFGGMALVEKVAKAFGLKNSIEKHVPTEGFVGETSPVEKFLGLILGMTAGADCLDDLEVFSADPTFSAVAGKLVSPNRYSEFLASFDVRQLREMQDKLIDTSFKMRKVVSTSKSFHLFLDSTKHDQFGLKQEGVNWSYTDYKCLDSLQAYDELGFPYWYTVRPGETHTASGSEEVLSAVFRSLPKEIKERYVLADSGYYSSAFFNACVMQHAKFVVAMRENVYGPLLHKRVLNWKKANGMKFFDKREFEYAETVHQHKECRHATRIIFVRALKNGHEEGLFSGQDYDYAAFVTNIGMHEMKAIYVLKKYRMRANGENFIREMKNGIDTRRFQCRRLVSNGAIAIAGAFARAILCFMAHVHDKKLVHFAKRLRNCLISIPCQVVRHGRETVFRMAITHYVEVENWNRKYLNDISLLQANYLVQKSSPWFLKT